MSAFGGSLSDRLPARTGSGVTVMLVTALLIFINCSHSVMQKNAGLDFVARDQREAVSSDYTVVGTAETVASEFNLLWVWGVTRPARFDLAILKAIVEKGGDAMVDIEINREEQYWLVGTVIVYHIEGTVIKYKRADGEEPADG